MDYVGYFPHWNLVTTRSGDYSENSIDDRREQINIDRFFNPAGFPMIDVMPQNLIFSAEYFIEHVLTPFRQHSMSPSQDAARRNPNLRIDNSRCHAARSATDEMAKLPCRRAAHPLDSLDLGISDFCLFSRLKHKLFPYHAHGDRRLLQVVQGILTGIDRSEVKKLLGTRSSDVTRSPCTKVNTVLKSK
jgi:hypothetical protein